MNLLSLRNFRISVRELLAENSFKRNLALTFSGQAVGQVLGFLFTPFIARAYGPETYGIFSIFVAISTNLFSFATLQLPTGYVSARNSRELHVLIQITLFNLFLVVGLSLVIISAFKTPVLELLNASSLNYLIYAVPVYAFFMGIDYVVLGWNIYLKEFGRGAIAKTSSILVSKSLTLCYAILIAPASLGLIAGSLTAYPTESLIRLSKKMRSEISFLRRLPSWSEIKGVLIRYKSYPLLVTPGLLVSSINGQIPLYLFSLYFQNTFAGFFSMANSVVTVPLSVITNSTTTVFLQKAAETHRNNPELLKELVLKLNKRLFLAGFFPLTLFGFLSPWLFVLIFGRQWNGAGTMAAFLAIGAILSTPQQPLSVLFRLLDREQYNLALNTISIFLRTAGLAVGIIADSINVSIACYTLASILTLTISLGTIFSLVKLKLGNLAWYIIAVLTVFSVLTFQTFYR